MRQTVAITLSRLKELGKMPSLWITMIVMPIVFSFIFGTVAVDSDKNKPVVYLVKNKDPIAQEIAVLLTTNDRYRWVAATEQKAKRAVADQKAAAAVVIPDNPAKRLERHKPLFEVIVQHKDEKYAALKPYLNGVARSILSTYEQMKPVDNDQLSLVLQKTATNLNLHIDKTVPSSETNTRQMTNVQFVGFTIMFMMFGLSGATSAILDERKAGTWPRLLTTPLTKAQIMFGYVLAYFCIGWAQFAILIVSLSLIFGVQWGNMLYLIPFASLVILSVVGFGLTIAGLVKTKQQASALAAVLIVSTCMLGGVYWPLDIVPNAMQEMAKAVPQSWAIAGMQEIMSNSLHGPTLRKATLALLAFTVVFFTLGLKRIKFD